MQIPQPRGLLSHNSHLEKTYCLCPLSLALKSFKSRPRGAEQLIDFILLGLKMAARDSPLVTVATSDKDFKRRRQRRKH
jgi:hypothetical protein